jgi:hypothetical protein
MRTSQSGGGAAVAAENHIANGGGDLRIDAALKPETLEGLFNKLVAEWRQSMTPATTLASLLAHPAYNRIIGMGLLSSNAIVPLILKDLSSHPRQWFQALHEITGEDPVPAEATTFEEFRQAWLSWGRERSLF